MAPIVKETAIPEIVTPLPPLMEVKVVSTVEEIEPIENILASMRMDDIQKHSNTHTMGCIN